MLSKFSSCHYPHFRFRSKYFFFRYLTASEKTLSQRTLTDVRANESCVINSKTMSANDRLDLGVGINIINYFMQLTASSPASILSQKHPSCFEKFSTLYGTMITVECLSVIQKTYFIVFSQFSKMMLTSNFPLKTSVSSMLKRRCLSISTGGYEDDS